MKHLLLITIVGLVQVGYTHAQLCNEMEIILGDQAAVDQYNTNFPECHEQINRLVIEGDDITNLQGLSAVSSCADLTIKNTPNLHSLEGLNSLQQVVNLFIENTGITSFNGLESLDTVGFLLHIYGNDQLKDLTGLSGLIDIYGLFITECDSFQSFNGLHALKRIKALAIDYNRSLVNMAGFPNIDTIRQIYLAYNDNMTNLTGLESITLMTQDLQIRNNPKLTSLQGLHFLENVRDVELIDNPRLVTASGLDALESILGRFLVQGDSGLINLAGLSSLTSVAEDLILTGNISLQGLEGLNALTSIGGHFQIDENQQLWDLTHLSNLTSIGGQLLISNNDQLNTLNGLDQLASIGDLEITFNDLLQACSQESICHYLQAGGQAVIGGNAQGCANRDQVLESCLVGAEEISASGISIFPNPATSYIHIQSEEPIQQLTLFNNLGMTVYQLSSVNQTKVDVEVHSISGGLYWLRAVVGEQEVVYKAVVVER